MAKRKKAARGRLLFWRRALALAVLAISAAATAPAAEDPASVRRLMAAGAVELALSRVESRQPRDMVAASWAEWEALRCEALARLGRYTELGDRLVALTAGSAPVPLNVCLVEGARAALARNDPVAARVYAARLLWQRRAAVEEARAARLAVIESYVAERRGEDAFRSMLRFQQDYQPLDRAVAVRFAEALLDVGQDREALNFLGRIDEVSPARLRLQLRGSLLSSEAVVAQARAALARGGGSGYWRAIHEAAVRSRNGALQIEALERLLQSADARNEAALAEGARRLQDAYLEVAGEIANREQLLRGDDGAWADHAARRLAATPQLARAFYGHLAQHAGNGDIRRNAQLQLTYSLSSSGLDYVALRLLPRLGVALEALDPQARHLLGTLAAKRNDAELALKLWDGLSPPPAANAIEWQLTLARTALRAGDVEASVATMVKLLSGRTTISAALAQGALDLAQEMLDLRSLDAAQKLYELIAPLAPEARGREAYYGLGRVHELSGEPLAAATSYLRAALLPQGTAADPLALQARLLAALNLMRAGFKDDARSQFEWLLRNAKEPALTEAARRGLGRL